MSTTSAGEPGVKPDVPINVKITLVTGRQYHCYGHRPMQPAELMAGRPTTCRFCGAGMVRA